MNMQRKQQGAVLIIALVMLMIFTLLSVSSIRSTTMETRITGNRIQTTRLINLADAALREGEFRLYGPGYIRDKLEADMAANCTLNNKLDKGGLNKPCLLNEMSRDNLNNYFASPITTLGQASNDPAISTLNWMPYRGLDAEKPFVQDTGNNEPASYWNVYRLADGAEENAAFNAEYGAAMQGRGTFFYLVTGQANNEVAVQSTVTTVYLGLE